MNETVRAMQNFSAAMSRVVEQSVRQLAPENDPVVSIEWADGNLTHLIATLQSGRVIRGQGPARLEAIQDAAERMGRRSGESA